MSEQDDLQDAWRSYPPVARTSVEELEQLLIRRIRHFDRMIVTRNWLECSAGVFVAVFFFRFGILVAQNRLEKVGSLLVAASAVWIVFYFVRHSRISASLDTSRTLVEYSRALLDRYEHQIRFSRSIKYWYLFPPYVGLIIASAGALLDRAKSRTLNWQDWGGPVFYTIVFLIVWWLNEIHAVGRLRKERAKLRLLTDENRESAGN